MSTSRRKLIRDRVADLLKGKTRAGNRVFTNRSSATWAVELPVIAVYNRSEDSEIFGEAPREYKRILKLAIEVIADGSENPADGVHVDDALDEIAVAVEDALELDDRLGETTDERRPGKKIALVDRLTLTSVEFAFKGDGERPEGAAIMLYDVVYYAYPVSQAEQDGISDLKTVDAKWEVGSPDAPPNFGIEDKVTIP